MRDTVRKVRRLDGCKMVLRSLLLSLRSKFNETNFSPTCYRIMLVQRCILYKKRGKVGEDRMMKHICVRLLCLRIFLSIVFAIQVYQLRFIRVDLFPNNKKVMVIL